MVTVESILLYGAESWTLIVQQQKALNCIYIRMLRKYLNVSCQEHVENKKLYGNLPPVYVKVRSICMRMAGHNVRHLALYTNPLIFFWSPLKENLIEDVTY